MLGFAKIEEGIFAQIPLKTKGQLYVSPMPFGPYDRHNRLLKMYRHHRIKQAVVLVTDDEIQRKARRDLFKTYQDAHIDVLHHPIMDLTSPSRAGISALVPKVARSLHYHNVVIHCNAGVGRTGIVTACIVKHLTQCSGDEALAFIKKHMHIRITAEQKRLVLQWSATADAE